LQDVDGKFGLDLGITGAPETYVVDSKGIVRMRYQGDLNERVWAQTVGPVFEKVKAEKLQSKAP
jgi:cytochrome c biogenesis protein CcmG/thiol:disulfide interchange protein DsbE